MNRNSPTILITKCLFLIAVIISVNIGVTHAVELKIDKNIKQGNRWEAIVQKNVSGSFRLVSFTQSRLASYSKGDLLKLHIYLPQKGKARITANNIVKNDVNYQMEVKKTHYKKGWSVFEPWSVNNVLDKHGIRARNLGIEATLNDGTYLPILLRKNGINAEVNKEQTYVLHFFTPANIKSIKYIVFNESQETLSGEITDLFASSTFNLDLNTDEMDKGFYELTLNITWSNNRKSTYKYPFYHAEYDIN
ncbi:hypothetical protein [Colwellia sp. Arc7-D]|uniref:hypothetical protein n=1 Tax=Colwellia sp. Arc7-D TaxID=2161872 RepID=UPI000D362851|nr:hypothetical protein [Colwellia sp. Arc7-D]AWB57849.1 hypothetical protein DBO93_09880 [Colwellia sp. Arc7-D]